MSRTVPSSRSLTAHRFPKYNDEVNDWTIGAFDDRSIPESVRDDIDVVKNHEMVSDDLKAGTVGFVWNLKTGKLEKV